MLLVGGVITKDMEENCVYAGTPAKDVTSSLGNQYKNVNIYEKKVRFEKLYIDFLSNSNISKAQYSVEVVESFEDLKNDGSVTYFNLNDRSYLPNRSDYEYAFIKYMLYDKAKFVPILI